MASSNPYPLQAIPDSDERNLEHEIQNIIQNLSHFRNSPEESFSNLELDQNIRKILEKLNEMIFKLQHISSILRDFLNPNYFVEKMGSFVVTDPNAPKEVLQQVEDTMKIIESYIPKLRLIRGNSEKLHMILIQQVLDGVQIPKMEDFNPTVPMSITNICMNSIQDGRDTTNSVGTLAENTIKVIIEVLAGQCADSRCCRELVESALTFIIGTSVSLVKTSFQLIVYRNDAYNKISEFKRQFNKCGITRHLERIDNYLEQAIKNSQTGNAIIVVAIKQCLCQVRESVNSSKQREPHKPELELVREMSETPACSGLVQPITTNMRCSEQQAWDIVMQLFSSLSDPAIV